MIQIGMQAYQLEPNELLRSSQARYVKHLCFQLRDQTSAIYKRIFKMILLLISKIKKENLNGLTHAFFQEFEKYDQIKQTLDQGYKMNNK